MEKLVLTLNVSPQKYEANQQFMQKKGADYVPAGIQKSIEKTTSTTHSTPFESPAFSSDISLESGSEQPDSRGNSATLYHPRSESSKIP